MSFSCIIGQFLFSMVVLPAALSACLNLPLAPDEESHGEDLCWERLEGRNDKGRDALEGIINSKTSVWAETLRQSWCASPWRHVMTERLDATTMTLWSFKSGYLLSSSSLEMFFLGIFFLTSLVSLFCHFWLDKGLIRINALSNIISVRFSFLSKSSAEKEILILMILFHVLTALAGQLCSGHKNGPIVVCFHQAKQSHWYTLVSCESRCLSIIKSTLYYWEFTYSVK